MASKYYVVWIGIVPGIYRSWEQCKAQVYKYPGAKYKSFATEVEAEAALLNKPLKTRNPKTLKSKTKDKNVKKSKQKKHIVRTYDENGINSLQVDTKIFTDGACVPNPGEAGSGIAVYRDNELAELWYGIYEPDGTSNTAELNALLQGLMIASGEVDRGKSVAVITDSKYSLQCVTQWAFSWEKKGWKKGKGESIKNLDLIKPMHELYQTLSTKIKVLHVNGHVGIEGNELADRMSMMAIDAEEADFARYKDNMNIDDLLALREG